MGTRQREWQLKRIAEGKCSKCGKERDGTNRNYCISCLEKNRLASRASYMKKTKK